MEAPLAWIKNITKSIPELAVIPLFGNAPPFDWRHFTKALKNRLEVPQLKMEVENERWLPAHEMKKGLGEAIVDSIVVAPLGTVFWIFSQKDRTKLTTTLLKQEGKAPLTSEILQEGFYRYLLLEALGSLQEIPIFKEFSLQLSEEERIPEGDLFCIDVKIDLGSHTCWGRLAIDASFRSAWVHHFEKIPSEYVPTELSRQLYLDLSIETGSVLLHQEEWDHLKLGDFVILDQGSYDVQKETGVAMLMLGRNPLFNVRLRPNQIELTDYAFYYEDNMPQNSNSLSSEPAPNEGEVVAIKELPLLVNVEIARMKMTLDKLMHLHPGNIIEIPIHPDQSVSLVVNGQKVGRAELVRLGETLGLRIIEIG